MSYNTFFAKRAVLSAVTFAAAVLASPAAASVDPNQIVIYFEGAAATPRA